MRLAEQPAAGTFAGFSLEYSAPNTPPRPIKNLLNFAGTDTITSSVLPTQHKQVKGKYANQTGEEKEQQEAEQEAGETQNPRSKGGTRS